MKGLAVNRNTKLWPKLTFFDLLGGPAEKKGNQDRLGGGGFPGGHDRPFEYLVQRAERH